MTTLDRRWFLQLGALSALLLSPLARAAAAAAGKPRYLLLVELNGGNDGLNTVVPYTDAEYYRARPTLAIAREHVIQLDERVGLNPALAPLEPLWKDKRLAIVQGVGYESPNRSHFRSIEIWDTASAADEYLRDGWLARPAAQLPGRSGFAADAVVIGRNAAPVSGSGTRTLVFDNLQQFASRAAKVAEVRDRTGNPALQHLLAVQDQVHAAAGALLRDSAKLPELPVEFPRGAFGTALQQAARLIQMQQATPIIKVALGSFDTHANQRAPHDRLLGELAAGLAAFRSAMAALGVWDRVLVMTYSEFGRRVAQNGSQGTDHGTAAPHLVLGGAVKGGLYGQGPGLTDLEGGDLRHAVDFRSVYNTVIQGWWGLTASVALEPARFARQNFLR